jgi:hypothetical protein
MIWHDEGYRTALFSGDVAVGAVYQPGSSAVIWHWRIWINRRGHVHAGRASSCGDAKSQVERRFRAFLDAAQLVQIGGDA